MNVSTVLPALYVVNKHAKRFAENARQAHSNRNHKQTNRESNKRQALYSVKEAALQQMYPKADTIEKHIINGDEYYHFEFEDNSSTWQFHLPVDTMTISSKKIEQEETLHNFESTQEITGVTMSLKEALQAINTELHINANTHLPHNEPTIWPYLY